MPHSFKSSLFGRYQGLLSVLPLKATKPSKGTRLQRLFCDFFINIFFSIADLKTQEFVTTEAPNGINASLAILKHCIPIGMPIIVKLHRHPINAASAASSKPLAISQRIFSSIVPAPPPYRTSFPKGKKLSCANLKHCMPTGIPTMVMHQSTPAKTQPSPSQIPPNRNQIKFPRHPI